MEDKKISEESSRSNSKLVTDGKYKEEGVISEESSRSNSKLVTDGKYKEDGVIKSIIESILFAKGEEIEISILASVLELEIEKVEEILIQMEEEYKSKERGIEIVRLNNSVQLSTNPDNFEYISNVFDHRNKPNLSNAALEVLAIIAYNPKVSRAEIEAIRGVNSDNTVYKLLEYGLIEEAGKIDAPGKPMGFKTSNEFLRIFGYTSLEELPPMPRFLDEQTEFRKDLEQLESISLV